VDKMLFWAIILSLVALVLLMLWLDLQKMSECSATIRYIKENDSCRACNALAGLGLITIPTMTADWPPR
jgi:hypothetical protein